MQLATKLDATMDAPAEGADRRQAKRYALMLPGNLIRRDGAEFRCVTENASVGGFEIICGQAFFIGDEVSLMLHHLERVDLEVMRVTPRGFGGRIVRTSMPRREFLRHIKDLIDSQAGVHAKAGTLDQRRHARHIPADRETSIQLMGGHPIPARLIDVSQSGAAVESDLRMSKGRRVLLGRRPSTVVRVFGGGFAVQFDQPLEARRPAAA
jgi:hypothetical protein